jgi:hypothetical protein
MALMGGIGRERQRLATSPPDFDFFAHHPTPACPNKRISTRGVSPEQYAALKNASERFFAKEDFSYPQTTELMKTVFGSDCASPEALAWAK